VSSALDSLGGLAKSAGIFFAGTVLANILGILGEILIPRALAPAVYGRLGLAYGIVTAISSLAILGAPSGVTRFLSEDEAKHQQADVLQSGYAIALVGSIIAAIAIYVSRFEIASLMNDSQIAPLLVAFVPYLVAFPVAKVTVGTLRAQGRTTAAVLAQRIGPRVGGLLLVAGFIVVGQPVIGAIGYWLAFPVLGALLALYCVQQQTDLASVVARLPDQDAFRDLWSFSWPLAAGASLHILLSNIDLVMLGYFLDSAAVGYYRSIRPLRQVIFFLLRGVFVPLPAARHPTLHARRYQRTRRTLHRYDEMDRLADVPGRPAVHAVLTGRDSAVLRSGVPACGTRSLRPHGGVVLPRARRAGWRYGQGN
jgi:O-antigen/teichoic acid export membrane protein